MSFLFLIAAGSLVAGAIAAVSGFGIGSILNRCCSVTTTCHWRSRRNVTPRTGV